MADLYLALVHFPVLNKEGDVITASVTNLDVHDISRSCRTFGVKAFYVVTPVDALRGLVRRIMRHWQDGLGSHYNHTRAEALDLVRPERNLDGAIIDAERGSGQTPILVSTSAGHIGSNGGAGQTEEISYGDLASLLGSPGPPLMLVLGTAWGLAPEVTERCGLRLPPICGPTPYNHLSVRAAAAILLDRLLGKR